MKRKVLIIYTGGTIGMEKDYSTGSLVPFDFSNIFERMPEMNLMECEVSVKSFDNPIDSSDMGPKEWQLITKFIEDNYKNFDGFVILHGTDTMSYTASALSFMLRNLKKPVILTGSQLPIGDLRTDAKENLLTSIYYASHYHNDEALIQEVALYFEYKLLRGNRSLKVSAEYFDAYQSPNYPLLGQSGVHLKIDKEHLLRHNNKDFYVDKHLDESILFWRIFPGMNFDFLLDVKGVQVIILQVFGSGTIFNNDKTERILTALRERNIEIIVISQCVSGGISFGKYSNSNIFTRVGAINGKDMTAEATITKSMHLLNNPNNLMSFSDAFSKNICGEVTENFH